MNSGVPSNVTVVLPDLGCGGMQRAAACCVSGFLARGYCVTVVTFTAAGGDFFRLPEGARRLGLGIRPAPPTSLPRLIPTTLSRLHALRAAIASTEPDVVITYGAPVSVLTLLALYGCGCRVIVTEHGDVSTRADARRPGLWKKWAWYRLRRICYPWAHKVVSVSQAVDRGFPWLARNRRAVIHNPVAVTLPPRPHDPPPGASPERPWIVSVGRLVPDKGFDVLLAAFAAIAARFPRWQLLIVGDGALLHELRRQARDLDDQVIFTGAIATPFSLLRRAQLFVMASRYEGFPLAHAEALACGVPVIATDCPSRPRRGWERREPAGGVRELVLHNVNGVLVRREDPVALAHAMTELMEDPARREAFAREAVHIVARFSAESVMDQWQQLLRQAVP